MKSSSRVQFLTGLVLTGLLAVSWACAPQPSATDTGSSEAEVQPSETTEASQAAEPDWDVDEAAVQSVVAACQAEVEAYCSQVTPGGGRLLACFAAHEDKLSGECSKALYGFPSELEAFTRALAFTAHACYEDITRLCADVEAGEGRVAECLLENQSEVSAECLEAVGLER